MRKNLIYLGLTVFMVMLLPGLVFKHSFDRNPVEEITETTITEIPDITEVQTEHVSVLMDDGTVKSLELEEYIFGVVLCEMPADFDIEALKAQAVVARTYTMRRNELGGKHPIADICASPACCQGYCSPDSYSGSSEQLKKVRRAVMETTGAVLLYNGELIEATYYSCSGGMTEDALAVWGSDIPYLRAVESPGEEKAAHFTDTVSFTVEEFARLLGVTLSGRSETWLEDVSYTDGGGVKWMRLCGVEYPGTLLRERLGLRSTAFVLRALGDTVTITTKGYGHRVGMSQYGADAMALQGHDYAAILAHYYPGTSLQFMNP